MTVDPTKLCPMAANPAEAGPVAEVPPGTSVAGQAGEGRLARADEPAGPGEPGESGDSTELGEPAGPGDPAACCGARTRGGAPCGAVPMANGRCRIHGGTSTGPRTMEGMARMIASKTTHGRDGPAGAPKRAAKLAVRRVIVRGQLLSAASDLRAYLPAAMAARLALPVLELAASPHWSHSAPQLAADLADLLNSATTLGSSAEGHACGVDADGPAAGEQAPIEGIPITPARRVAERLAARAEAAVRAPWKAAIAFARAAKREARGNAGQSGDGAARDLRNDPRDERPGACPRDEAAVVGSPGDSSLRTSWRDPTLVSATQPGAAGWAHWPLQDLRNNPPSKRAGACARGEAAAVGSPGDASLPASPCGPTLASATRPEAAVRANLPLRDLRNDPRVKRPRACPRVPGACPGQQPAAAPGHDGGPGAARRLAPSLAEALRGTTPAGTWQPSERAELEALFGATARMERTAPPGRSAPPVTPVVSPRCSVGIVCNDPSRRLVWDGVRGDAWHVLWPGGAEVGTQEGG